MRFLVDFGFRFGARWATLSALFFGTFFDRFLVPTRDAQRGPTSADGVVPAPAFINIWPRIGDITVGLGGFPDFLFSGVPEREIT